MNNLNGKKEFNIQDTKIPNTFIEETVTFTDFFTALQLEFVVNVYNLTSYSVGCENITVKMIVFHWDIGLVTINTECTDAVVITIRPSVMGTVLEDTHIKQQDIINFELTWIKQEG